MKNYLLNRLVLFVGTLCFFVAFTGVITSIWIDECKMLSNITLTALCVFAFCAIITRNSK